MMTEIQTIPPTTTPSGLAYTDPLIERLRSLTIGWTAVIGGLSVTHWGHDRYQFDSEGRTVTLDQAVAELSPPKEGAL